MNLVGVNPVTFFEQTQWHHASYLRQVLEAEKTAFTVMVSTRQVPDFVRRYPALVDGLIPSEGLAGWRIEYTYYGAPKRWTPLISNGGDVREGKMALADYDEALLSSDACRRMIRFPQRQTYGWTGPANFLTVALWFSMSIVESYEVSSSRPRVFPSIIPAFRMS